MIRREVIGDATVYLGDAREVIPGLSPVDVVAAEPAYFDIACRRLEEAHKAPRLFVGETLAPSAVTQGGLFDGALT